MRIDADTASAQRWSAKAATLAKHLEERSRSRLAPLLVGAYGFRPFRRICLGLCRRLEGGTLFSRTLRAILARHHSVSVGTYTYGPVLEPGLLPRGTIVGNYCSVAPQLVVLRRDHPLDRLTQHPFFYNSGLGIVERDTIEHNEDNPLVIGHDVWIGERVLILAGCRTIGNGAVVAAGSVVTRDVLPYTVVGGAPAKPLKLRFDKETIAQLEMSRWWELTLEELLQYRDWLLGQMNSELAQSLRHEILSKRKR